MSEVSSKWTHCKACRVRFDAGNFNGGRAKVCAACRPEYRRLVELEIPEEVEA